MSTIQHVWQLIQHGDHAFSIDLLDAYLYIPIVKHHHQFCLTQTYCSVGLCWDTVDMSVSLPPDKVADVQW